MPKFACAINCMDGRVQDAVTAYMRRTYGVDYVDMVTEAGPNRILAEYKEMGVIRNIVKRVEISVNRHGSDVVAIVGHPGCAGNPTDKEQQLVHLRKAKEVLASCLQVKIVLLWVNEDWSTVEVVPPA